MQRGQEYEIGYSRKMGSRTYQVSAYSESVSNLALSMVSPAGFFSGVDVLPDLFSGNSIFNAGTFDSVGYSGAVIQNFGDHVSATVIYGSTGALTTNGRELVSNNPDELRSMIHAGRRQAATTRLNAIVPWTGTHLVASYQWAAGGDQHWVEPGNLYSTRSQRPLPGFNIHIRQPIPGFGGRIEATADLRNLLAQGYLGLKPRKASDSSGGESAQRPRRVELCFLIADRRSPAFHPAASTGTFEAHPGAEPL